MVYSEELNTMTSDLRILEYDHIISTNAEMMNEKKRNGGKSKEIEKYLALYKKQWTQKRMRSYLIL